jgi:hypothetical protein
VVRPDEQDETSGHRSQTGVDAAAGRTRLPSDPAYSRRMRTPPALGLDVGALLDRVTGTAPIAAVDAAADALAEMLGARDLTFLIADLSGRAVIRLTTAGAGVTTRAWCASTGMAARRGPTTAATVRTPPVPRPRAV